ncbi:helix-turn-helix domain-containing protein [Aerococcus christensenii]|uniref:helix-turn-helix domain-containing protein n=1 Tax=Aerococcus christensenii TaxID=87541 RepID=UPI0026CE80A8
MSKYSYQLKKEVVQAYLEGKGSCAFFAKQYGIKSKSQIRRWINKQEKRKRRKANVPMGQIQ